MTALYLLGAFLVLLLVGVVLAPLIEREPPDRDLEELPPDERRDAAVEALSELEFEYRTDKLPEEEYRRLRTHYGRIALRAEEELGEDGAATAAGRREDPGVGPSAAGGEAAAPGRPASAEPAGTGTGCPECGTEVPDGARFCPGCGARRPSQEEAQ